jgi:tetratricopeptide (TPR) repeat protein
MAFTNKQRPELMSADKSEKPKDALPSWLGTALILISLFGQVPKALAEESTETLMRTAKSHFDAGEYEKSQESLKAALLRENNNSPKYALCLQNLALLQYLDFNFQDAEKLYLRAISTCESLYGCDSNAVANNLYGLSRCLRRSHQFEEAEHCLDRLLILRSKLFGEDHGLVANTLLDIAVNYEREGKTAEADQFYQRVIELRQKQFGRTSPSLSPFLKTYAKFLHSIQKDERASQIEARMIELSHSADETVPHPKEEDGSGWQSK